MLATVGLLIGGCSSPSGSVAGSKLRETLPPESLARLAEAWADGGKALERGDWSTAGWAFERVLEIDPEEEVARHLAAVARARIEAETDTLEHLRRLRDLGSDLVPELEALGTLGERAEVRSVLDEVRAAARIRAAAPVALKIDIPDLYPEGIAWDPETGALFIGSLHRREILRVPLPAGSGDETEVERLVPPGNPDLGAVVGLRVDAERRYLWAATGADPLAQGFRESERGRSWLVRFDLDTGELQGRWDPPEPESTHQLNDVAIDSEGNAWVTDTYTGAVYRLAQGSTELEIAQSPGSFLWPNGIAASPDGRSLWIADWRYGVTHLDLETGRRSRLSHPPGVSIHGFDGLYAYEGDLVGILNPVRPARVVRLRLAEGEPRVVAQELLVTRHPAFDIPTTGAVAHDSLWLIANSQMRSLGPDGRALDASDLRPIDILRVDLR